jgi:hypothetical protein
LSTSATSSYPYIEGEGSAKKGLLEPGRFGRESMVVIPGATTSVSSELVTEVGGGRLAGAVSSTGYSSSSASGFVISPSVTFSGAVTPGTPSSAAYTVGAPSSGFPLITIHTP